MALSRSVAVVDYGMGNLRSVAQALSKAAEDDAVQVVVTSDPADVAAAERVVLPGQGAMRDCMAALGESGLETAVREAAREKPLLGVCVGMQMLLDHSEEQDTPGLGLIAGRVLRFRLADRLQPDGSRCKVPQMGWNRVWQTPAAAGDAHSPHPLWRGIADGEWFYFVHSYHAVPAEARAGAAATEYGDRFTSAIARDNIFATQFHPEKSASQGLALYRNFLRWKP